MNQLILLLFKHNYLKSQDNFCKNYFHMVLSDVSIYYYINDKTNLNENYQLRIRWKFSTDRNKKRHDREKLAKSTQKCHFTTFLWCKNVCAKLDSAKRHTMHSRKPPSPFCPKIILHRGFSWPEFCWQKIWNINLVYYSIQMVELKQNYYQ